MQRPFRTVAALFTVCGLLLSLALGPSITRPAAAAPLAVATITVDTGNDSNTEDDELSLHEALDAVSGDKKCFTDHEASLISGVTLNPDIFLTCGEAPSSPAGSPQARCSPPRSNSVLS
jgi:hypothetical protein